MTTKFSPTDSRPYLKWAGGKFRLMPLIKHYFEQHNNAILVEPFVGAGAVFLNSPHSKFILNDLNKDVINLHTILKKNSADFIIEAQKLFQPKYNQKKTYLAHRHRFNQSCCAFERSILFLYLNRHGYNGLCRYNQSLQFNVPFGEYANPYFPEKELRHFGLKAKKAQFSHLDFSDFFNKLIHKVQHARLPNQLMIYCDPPYVPLNKTARFTQYAGEVFNENKQSQLANFAERLASLGATVIISNHDTEFTRALYDKAKIVSFEVKRTISCDPANRLPVKELLAIFKPVSCHASEGWHLGK